MDTIIYAIAGIVIYSFLVVLCSVAIGSATDKLVKKNDENPETNLRK